MRKGLYGESSVVALIVAMSVVAIALVATIVYFETSSMHVRRQTDGMLSNAVPAIDQLTAARATLRALDGAMDKALLDLIDKRPVDVTRLTTVRRGLSENIASYRALPFYDLEAELNRNLDEELANLDDVRERLTTLLLRGDLQAVHELENGEWRERSDDVDAELRKLSSFNLRHVTRHAGQIDDIRRRSALVGFGVGTGGLILALAATIVAARAVRRQTCLQEERARELELFSARVAHDVMSPVQSVSLALQMGAEQIRDPAVGQMMIRAHSALKRVRLIVDGLLEFARAGGRPAADARAPVGKVLASVIEDARTSADQAGIELRLEPAPAVHAACSAGVLTVVVGNLVNNALKHMGDSSPRVITLRAEDGGRMVLVEVADTGPGVPAGAEEKIFDPYVRGTESVAGLGLGLATVKRFVDAHGGRVGVRRANGAGSVFWFELPKAT